MGKGGRLLMGGWDAQRRTPDALPPESLYWVRDRGPCASLRTGIG